MKKIISLFLLLLSMTFCTQSKIKEGKIVVKESLSSTDEARQAELANKGVIEKTIYFKNERTREEALYPNSRLITRISDIKNILELKESAKTGKTYKVKRVKSTKRISQNVTVVKGELEKIILGYRCKQYFITVKERELNMVIEVFTTEKIDLKSELITSFGAEIKGYVLYGKTIIDIEGAPMTFIIEVVDIKKIKVAESLLSMTPPDGYKNLKS